MGTVPMFAAETTLPWKKSFAAAKIGLPLRPGKSYNPMRLVSETSGKVLIGRLTVADTFWSRFVGLQFQRKLAAGAGLLLVPCSSVHTSFLRFPWTLFSWTATDRFWLSVEIFGLGGWPGDRARAMPYWKCPRAREIFSSGNSCESNLRARISHRDALPMLPPGA